MLHSYGGIIWPCCRNSDGWGDGCWHARIVECWKAWCCQRTRGYTKELQDLCHEWEVESMHNLSIQTPLGLLDFLVLPRGTLMICRCATSRVAVVNRVKKSSISFMVYFPTCSLAFCDVLYGSWRVHFLTLQGTNIYRIPRHFWRWCSFCHSFPQICAFVPWRVYFRLFCGQVPKSYRDASLRIGVFSLCDYTPESPMHWLSGSPGPVHFFGDGKCHWIH